MKRQIRRGCFETNSSSMHSLVIRKEDGHFTPSECEDSCYMHRDTMSFYYSDMEFGRTPFDILTTFKQKLNYAIASYCGSWIDEDEATNIFEKEIVPVIKEVVPYVKDFHFSEVDHCRNYGYVDHQSDGLLKSFLEKEGITLKEFLTNKKYIVVIDGDEYCTWGRMKNAGLINLDTIEREYPPGDYPFDSLEYMEGNGAKINEETN